MYLIPIEKIVAGDILLTSENSATSKVIRKVTNSDFSHAVLYVGSGSYIHSDLNGVHSGNLQRLLFEKSECVKVFRINDAEAIKKACAYARSKIGTEYTIKGAVNAKAKVTKKANLNRQFCSRLVAQSFEYAGLKLVNDPTYCAPQELIESSLTFEVPNCTRKARPEEIEFAQSESPLEKQVAITNEILFSVRQITGEDIQTLEQVTDYVILNPEIDQQISDIYKNSGYLTMWEYELKKNPWRYSGELFMRLPLSKDELVELAIFERDSANKRHELYKNILENYFYIKETHNLEYAKINFELYKRLVENTLDNVFAAKYVLENT